MKADYINSPLAPMPALDMSEKWYEVARSREKQLVKKLDVFMYLSAVHDNAFELVYVSFDEINRCLTRCYHGKIVVRMNKNYLVIRKGLCWKRYLVLGYDEKEGMLALANRRKSRCWVLSKKMPYDKNAFEAMMKTVEKQGFDIKTIELLNG